MSVVMDWQTLTHDALGRHRGSRDAKNVYHALLNSCPHRGASVEFAEYRKYVPGDDLRRLDWRHARAAAHRHELRAEFTRQSGQLTVREGVVKGPAIGATIEGNIDYIGNAVRMSGTFVPMYGLNNMFGQIPIVGLFLGGGSNEGLIGVTYEVVGTLGQPVLRVNPISAMAPGVLRKIFEFGTGKQDPAANASMLASRVADPRPASAMICSSVRLSWSRFCPGAA